MAWSTPRIWAAAELVTAANMNTYLSDNLAELRQGGLALPSQATGDFIFASSATQLGRLAISSANTAIRRNSANTAWEMYRTELPRGTLAASASSITPNAMFDEYYELNALAATLTVNGPTGTPGNKQRLIISLRDNGTPRAIAWDAGAYQSGGASFPATTTANKFMTLTFIYNSTLSMWLLVGFAQEP